MQRRQFNLNSFVRFCWLGTLWGLLLFSCVRMSAQEPTFKNYQVSDGLPSNSVYYAFQDSKGWMWFGTEAGVARFNGQRFEKFTREDGLPDNEVFELHEDSKGRIWFSTFNGRPGYYLDGEFHNPENDSLLHKLYEKILNPHPQGFIASFFEDSKGRIWFGFRRDAYVRLDPDGTCIRSPSLTQFGWNMTMVRKVWENDQKEIFILVNHGVLKWINDSTFIEKALFPGVNTVYTRSTKWGKDTLLAFDENMIKLVNQQTGALLDAWELPSLHGSDVAFASEFDGRLWLGTRDGGLFTSDPQFLRMESGVSEFLKDNLVTSIVQDFEGNYWITTGEKGVFFTPSFDILSINEHQPGYSGSVSKLGRLPDGRIILGFDNRKFCIYGHDGIECKTIEVNTTSSRGRMSDFYISPSGKTWLINEHVLILYEKGNVRSFHVAMKGMVELPDKKMLIGTSAGTILSSEKEIFSLKNTPSVSQKLRENAWDQFIRNLLDKEPVTKMHVGQNGTIYVGKLTGLSRFDGKKLVPFKPELKLPEYAVSDIEEDDAGNLFISYYGQGLAKVSPEGESTLYTVENGLTSNFVRSITLDENGVVFLGTNKGISLMKPGEDGYRIIGIGISGELNSEDVNDVLLVGDKVWVGTSSGLNILSQRDLGSIPVVPALHISKLISGDHDWVEGMPEVPLRGTQQLEAEFFALSYRYAHQITYRYKIEGLDTTWRYSNLTRLVFGSIPPGDYQFIVQAASPYSDWSEATKVLPIKILPRFYQTRWFLVLSMAFAGLILWVIFRMRFRAVKTRAKLRQRAVENRQAALRAQMNPHFIFNSLNSLQRFILKNDTDAAYDFTAKFGRLVRQVLEHSKHNSIPLEQDLETLELYLELEAIRFDQKFSYSIEISPEIRPASVKIPPTIIQPFVENAIWHGVMPKNQAGNVQIRIRKEDKTMIIEVEDDGIGRAESKRINKVRSRMGESTGIQLTRERIHALYKRGQGNEGLEVVDLVEADSGAPRGTLIRLRIPLD